MGGPDHLEASVQHQLAKSQRSELEKLNAVERESILYNTSQFSHFTTLTAKEYWSFQPLLFCHALSSAACDSCMMVRKSA